MTILHEETSLDWIKINSVVRTGSKLIQSVLPMDHTARTGSNFAADLKSGPVIIVGLEP